MNEKEKALKLMELFDKHKDKKIFIAVIGSPDPDGISSAWGLKILGEKVGLHLDIFAFELISRPQNKDFVEKLKIPFKIVRDPFVLQSYDFYAVVDRQNPSLPIPLTSEIPLLFHIDHHSKLFSDAQFVDIRQEAGSTSTIITQYFIDTNFNFEKNNELHRRVSTALLYGIITDTNNFLRSYPCDHISASYLTNFVHSEILMQIAAKPFSKAFIQTLKFALNNMVNEDNWIIAYAGIIPREFRDTIGETADFLSSEEGVETVIVYGIIDGDIIGSLRSRNSNFKPYHFLRDALYKNKTNEINCGGRRGAGGFNLPLELINAKQKNIKKTKIKEKINSLLIKAKKELYK